MLLRKSSRENTFTVLYKFIEKICTQVDPHHSNPCHSRVSVQRPILACDETGTEMEVGKYKMCEDFANEG